MQGKGCARAGSALDGRQTQERGGLRRAKGMSSICGDSVGAKDARLYEEEQSDDSVLVAQ